MCQMTSDANHRHNVNQAKALGMMMSRKSRFGLATYAWNPCSDCPVTVQDRHISETRVRSLFEIVVPRSGFQSVPLCGRLRSSSSISAISEILFHSALGLLILTTIAGYCILAAEFRQSHRS